MKNLGEGFTCGEDTTSLFPWVPLKDFNEVLRDVLELPVNKICKSLSGKKLSLRVHSALMSKFRSGFHHFWRSSTQRIFYRIFLSTREPQMYKVGFGYFWGKNFERIDMFQFYPKLVQKFSGSFLSFWQNFFEKF